MKPVPIATAFSTTPQLETSPSNNVQGEHQPPEAALLQPSQLLAVHLQIPALSLSTELNIQQINDPLLHHHGRSLAPTVPPLAEEASPQTNEVFFQAREFRVVLAMAKQLSRLFIVEMAGLKAFTTRGYFCNFITSLGQRKSV